MPGFYGYAGKQISEGVDLLEQMTKMAQVQPWEDVSHFRAGSTGMTCITENKKTIANETSDLGFVAGEVFFSPKEKSGDTERRFVQGFHDQGLPFLNELEGKFAAVIYDARNQKLFLINDRFGLKPVYYAKVAHGVVFGTSIAAILAHPGVDGSLDQRGISQFFTFGHFLNHETFYASIRLLAPASVLCYEIETDTISTQSYWDFAACLNQNVRDDRVAALERICEALKTSVDQQAVGTSLGLALSGGLDSRTILGLIDRDQPLTNVSLGMAGSMDHDCAVEMSRLTNRTHHQFLLGETFLANFEEHLVRMVRLTDGHYSSQCIVMPTLPFYREKGIGVLLRGHAGELMHMGKAYNFSLDSHVFGISAEAQLEQWLWKRLQSYMLDGVPGPLFRNLPNEERESFARDSLKSAFDASRGSKHLHHRIWHLFTTQRLRRETAMSLVKFDAYVTTRVPLLSKDVVESLFQTPPQIKLDETVQRHVLQKHCPKLLNVINANTGAAMNAGSFAKLIAKVKKKVFAKLGVPGYQPYERLGLWLRRELRSVVEKILLSERCLDRGVFNPDTIRDVVARHFHGANHTYLILAMLVFEVGQREILDRQGHTPSGHDIPKKSTATIG